MNHDCNGDVFERWGKHRGRCILDSSFFDYEDGIEFCPNCKRPWHGVSVNEKDPDKQHSYVPEEDRAVLIEIDLPHFKRLAEERARKIAHLNEKLSRWQGMYFKASGIESVASPAATHESGG
jgi:hypothetical protein